MQPGGKVLNPIFGAKYRKIYYFAHILSLNLPEDDREAWNQIKMT